VTIARGRNNGGGNGCLREPINPYFFQIYYGINEFLEEPTVDGRRGSYPLRCFFCSMGGSEKGTDVIG
jgi:hypothetical protein